ncbi:6-pyruvoyltetrahydropterin/6-carboxytetrahydropterin synthase [Mucilaginibacter gracilis]|uniref:6-carboxy-5,6,7,8-tetrahydropterin synthase n=1 Tax=Mucilaginibacter gracilis TaxID=423350 RepID=A0A495J3M7_9SPHI|nr:6-carboxytetrahydropterin synthase QueD [Mucilaginibacter gracilis]RKR83580.1 6-pyruvoyltetrahydropterin/6-carboxytetrahydropterin synthase [Mucilaginibacter gracilis]
MIIFKKFTFDCAHYLPKVPVGHKCRNMHGHTYHVTFFIDGPIDDNLGWVMDFTDLKNIVKPVIQQLDHAVLNEIPGLENPTAENLAVWLWNELKPAIPQLDKIELMETPTSGVIYNGS